MKIQYLKKIFIGKPLKINCWGGDCLLLNKWTSWTPWTGDQVVLGMYKKDLGLPIESLCALLKTTDCI